jgi:hypothetical protein
MKTLELKHIAPYLEHKVKAITAHKDIVEIEGLYTFGDIYSTIGDTPFYAINLVLRPISDLTKEIEHNGEKFVPINKLSGGNGSVSFLYDFVKEKTKSIYQVNYWIVEKLFEWHFDIHNLIEKGLAVDINTLNK